MPLFTNLEEGEVDLKGWDSRPTLTNCETEGRIRTLKIRFYSQDHSGNISGVTGPGAK